MKMIKHCLIALTLMISAKLVIAQDAASYQTPPKVIEDLLLAKPTPSVSIDGKAIWMLLSERNSYPTVEELGQPEIRVAGLRLNPNNFSPSRQTFINNFLLKNLKENKVYTISGLPANLLAGSVTWSPSETKIAFTHTSNSKVELYVIDVATKKASLVSKKALNTVLGSPYTWVDDNTILYKSTVSVAVNAPKKPITPKGPTIQQNLGKAAPSPTYQDLIKSPYDEQLFQFYATAQLVLNKNGVETLSGKPCILSSFSLSPDKKYLLQKQLQQPFSYLVTANGFPSKMLVTDLTGKIVKVLAELPSTEGTPSGYDNTQNVPRSFDWRDDEAATITWAEPLDSGLIKKQAEYRDAIYAISAPFDGSAKLLFKTKLRYGGTTWGNENIALVNEISRSKQLIRVNLFNSSKGSMELLFERNQTDAYGNPGSPVTSKNKYGRNVITTIDNGSKLLMNNTTGSSPKGDLPFLAKFDLATKQNEIIWRCNEGLYEYIVDVLDANNLTLLSRKESQKDVPNYYIKNLKLKIADQAITNFTNPYPALEGVIKEKIKYKRADGVDLTGDLYLPSGYTKEKGPLPLIIWAYPREFNSAADAAQIRGSKDRFTTLSWGSPIYYVTQGYAVLDNAEMPIVASGNDKKPNDNFIDQLKLNAESAIGHLSGLGIADKNKVAVGGHSYGA